MKISIRKLLFYILLPLFLGSIVGFITSGSNNYNEIVQPSFAPPSILFPIVWTILYILMGVSSYIVSEANDSNKNSALVVYFTQLIVNLLWSFIFFSFRLYFFSFLWILLLIFLVVVMIRRFYNISKISGILQIPYLLWLIFAAILNLSIYILN